MALLVQCPLPPSILISIDEVIFELCFQGRFLNPQLIVGPLRPHYLQTQWSARPYARFLDQQPGTGNPHFHIITRTTLNLWDKNTLRRLRRRVNNLLQSYGIGRTLIEPIRSKYGIIIYDYSKMERAAHAFPHARIVSYSHDFPRTIQVANNKRFLNGKDGTKIPNPKYNPDLGKFSRLTPTGIAFRRHLGTFFPLRQLYSMDEVHRQLGRGWFQHIYYPLKLHIEIRKFKRSKELHLSPL